MKKSPLLVGSVFLVHVTAIAAMVLLQGCTGFQKRSGATISRSSSGSSAGSGFFSKFKSNRDRSYRTATTSRTDNYSSSSAMGGGAYSSAPTRVDRQIEFPPRRGQASAFSSDRVNAVSTPQLQSVPTSYSTPRSQSSYSTSAGSASSYSVHSSYPAERSASSTSSAMGAGSNPSFDSSSTSSYDSTGSFASQGGALIGSSPSVNQVISEYQGSTSKSFGGPSMNTSIGATGSSASTAVGSSLGLRTITVRKGDNLTKIARREGVTVKQIKAWNGLVSDRIDIGQKLSVGGASKASAPVSSWKPKAKSVKQVSTSSSFRKPVHQKGLKGVKYTIRSGDNLSTIAYKHGVKTSALKTANNITSDRIQVGWELLVPNPTKIVSSGSSTKPRPTGRVEYTKPVGGSPVAVTYPVTPTTNPAVSVVVPEVTAIPPIVPEKVPDFGGQDTDDFQYVVLEGDSISSIAATFITTTDQLRKRNPGLSDPLTVGTQIVIPPLD